MTFKSLPIEKLRRVSQASAFTFKTTAELDGSGTIIGQPRGTRSLAFGLGMQGQGYNVFVAGDSGTGRMTAVRRFVQERASEEAIPPDWVYVYNFSRPHHPCALSLPAGRGAALQADVARLIAALQRELPRAFAAENYRSAADLIGSGLGAQQERLLDSFEEQAAAKQFTLMHTPSGPLLAPVRNGKVIGPEAFAALPLEQRRLLEAKKEDLSRRLEQVMAEVYRLDHALQQEMAALNKRLGAATLEVQFAPLKEQYAGLPQIAAYLQALQEDVLRHLSDFLTAEALPDPRRYEVNLFVDNGQLEGAPVVLELNPSYFNLIGRIEYQQFQGMMAPHFTMLRAGSLHRANGGYLIIHARDIGQHRNAWEALKRALQAQQIRLQTPEALNGSPAPAQSLEPEAIPLRVKVILAGSDEWYYTFFDHEEEFAELFKVKAEFESSMVRNEAHEQKYAEFIARCCRREGLRHFTPEAVAKIVELGSRFCDDQNRLSAQFGDIADYVREANYWAGERGHELVDAQDVQQAIAERIYRANRIEERLQEQIMQGDLLIATEGAVVGQVNGLSVLDMGDYRFGTPGRITARTYMGEDGVVNIEREVDLAGPIHNKGLLTLIGYLGGTYAQNQPLSLSASLTFEQNYLEIDGDSASAAELVALLSSLSKLPVRQSIAVTGSINQHGEMQAVGGVTEKVEGFFRVCKQRGLNGEQGVLIPRANVNNLMLDEELVAAVAQGLFQVWAADSVDESLMLLLGVPAGERDETGQYPPETVHHLVQNALQRLALDLKSFGDRSDHDHDHDGDDD